MSLGRQLRPSVRRVQDPDEPDSGAADVDWHARVIRMYEKHDRSKLPNVDALLDKYKGREQELWAGLPARAKK